MRYEIRLAGRPPKNWADWFDGFACTAPEAGGTAKTSETPSETVLTGSIPDQSALVGLLGTVCRLNLTLLSVKRVD